VTENPDVVKPCRRIGSVSVSTGDKLAVALLVPPSQANTTDWTDSLKQATFEIGGNMLFLHGAHSRTGEAYQCSTNSAQAGQSTPTPPSTRIRIVGKEDDVRGCVFVDALDSNIDCPADYPPGTPCMAFRAKLQGGNTVLAVGGGKVYSCPVQPAANASR
jgi:hypothetical protein